MKITAIEAIPISYPEPNDNGAMRMTVLVRVSTDEGLVGWGEAIAMWPEACAAVKALIENGLSALIIGTDPLDVEAQWHRMREHCWWYGRGGIASFSIAAIDIALWDLKGQALGVPLYRLLGGRIHASLPAIASIHVTKGTPEENSEAIANYMADGFAGVKMGMGKRGLAGLGVDPARDVAYVKAAREAVGRDALMMMDAGNGVRWSPAQAIRMTRLFEPYALDWIEEPLHPDDVEGHRLLHSSVATRIATGEREWTTEGYRRLIDSDTVDVVGIDPGRAEGITGFLRVAALAALSRRKVNAHAWSTTVISAASLHLSVASVAAEVFEFKPLPGPSQFELVETPLLPQGGRAVPSEGPGLGIKVIGASVRRWSA
jgi:L-alanine-DL-glutamate epimerase-like enolase superfamily enzyme